MQFNIIIKIVNWEGFMRFILPECPENVQTHDIKPKETCQEGEVNYKCWNKHTLHC